MTVTKPEAAKKTGGALSKPVVRTRRHRRRRTPSSHRSRLEGLDHIRAHDLQDPADKRTIVADDKLRAVFGNDRATMFELNKLLSAHLTAS